MNNRHNWYINTIVTIIGIIITLYLNSINNTLNWQKHDLSILQEFHKAYFDENTKGLSLRYLKLIKDEKTQIEVRYFVTWDLLKQLVLSKSNIGQKYKFNENYSHYLCENLVELFEVDKDKGVELFNYLVNEGPNIYKDYSSKQEFISLLSWIRNRSKIIKDNIPDKLLQNL